MKKILFLLLVVIAGKVYAQKQIYIPPQFSTAPWNEWSWSKTYQTTNFCIFWGNKVGTNPATYSDPDLRFDPAQLAGYLESSFAKFITEVGFLPNTNNLGLYKIIVVMNDTYQGANGPTGWAFGGQYDGVIGAMWVHPGATRDPYVLSHEFTHSLQSQNAIDQNTSGGGFIGHATQGFFWETHANYMRCVEFPQFASDDQPRWTATGSFHLSTTRHHYAAFKWLMHIQQNYGGVDMVSRLWRESLAGEHPVTTFKRLKGWSQSQLNDFMYDYAKREVIFDYPAQSFGTYMRTQRNTFNTNAGENHYLWRVNTILKQINATTGRYIVPDYSAPADYGYNIIPLYTTCTSETVHVKFKGHTEVNSTAGWRWGFVAVKADGTTVRYSALNSANEGEATFTLAADETKLYLVVIGAPTSQTDYVWEIGWPKIKRYPYELRIENAVPEGYQSGYRDDIKALYAGHAHSNGGGWVANTATVASTVYVGPKAVVVGSSNLSGSVVVDGSSRLENVTASGSVVFNGEPNVWGGTYSNTAQILDRAILNDCNVSGNAIVKGNALAWGSTYGGSGVVIGGDAELGSCSTAGVYLQTPDPNNGREECDGKGANDSSNQDINSSYSQFTDTQMGWTAIGCGASNVPTVGKIYQINARHSGKSFTMRGGESQTGDNVQLIQYVYQGGLHQNFKVEAAGSYFRLTPQHATTKGLTVAGNSKTNNANIVQLGYGGANNQQWSFIDLGNGYFQIKSRSSGKCMVVAGASLLDDANVQQITCNTSSASQQFQFTEIAPGGRLQTHERASVPEETNAESDVVVAYPNPASGNFSVRLNGFSSEEDVELSIFSVDGRSVYLENVGKKRELSFNTSILGMSASVYVIKAKGNTRVSHSNLIVK